jgi:SAM-dependent methyltransferase
MKKLSDIISALDSDKAQSAGFLDNYERHMGHLRDKNVKILELGVYHGGSLLMWEQYFAKGLVVGLDLQPNPLKQMPERVRFYEGSQDDASLLNRLAKECAPEGFDIIIDDASHIGTLTRASFRNLFENHLKPGGIYVIEDWGTGYWNSWPDGSGYVESDGTPNEVLVKKSDSSGNSPESQHETKKISDPNFAIHNFGMVGFIKELIDEVSWRDVIRGNNKIPSRASLIREMVIYNGIVFVTKV